MPPRKTKTVKKKTVKSKRADKVKRNPRNSKKNLLKQAFEDIDVTKEQYSEFLFSLSVGVPPKVSAQYASIPEKELRKLLKVEEVISEVDKHKASMMVHHLKVLHGGNTNWGASAWALERVHPQIFSKRSPESYTKDQIFNLLSQFSQIILTEIQDDNLRERIQTQFRNIIYNMKAFAEGSEK